MLFFWAGVKIQVLELWDICRVAKSLMVGNYWFSVLATSGFQRRLYSSFSLGLRNHGYMGIASIKFILVPFDSSCCNGDYTRSEIENELVSLQSTATVQIPNVYKFTNSSFLNFTSIFFRTSGYIFVFKMSGQSRTHLSSGPTTPPAPLSGFYLKKRKWPLKGYHKVSFSIL